MWIWKFPKCSVFKELIHVVVSPKAFGTHLAFPDSSIGKESAYNAGDTGSIPGLGRSPGEGKGYPLQYSGLKNSMDIVHGVTKLDTTERFSLSLFTLLSKAGFDSVICGEWKSNLKVFESETTSPLNILTGNLFATLPLPSSPGFPFNQPPPGTETPLALSPPVPCHIQISLMALDLSPRQGVGMCQR